MCRLLPFLILQWRLLMSETITALTAFRAIDILNQRRSGHRSSNKFVSTMYENAEDEVINSDTNSEVDVETHFMEQPLDHFNTTALPADVSAVLYQRYFYSSRFVRSTMEDATIRPHLAFLCVGGEGPAMDESVLVDSVHCTGDMIELARFMYDSQGASVHLYALEHRYYGNSYPSFINTSTQEQISPITNSNLQWLSSRQAQFDLRDFVIEQNKNNHHAHSHTWITFGGSYPGMMAAWARKLHPQIIQAAVSSSAPIAITLDFGGYLDQVAWDLQYSRVGGSSQCLQLVMEGHAELASALLQDAGRHDEIAALFDLCDVSSLQDPKNVAMWLGDGVIMVPAQSNDPMGTDATSSIAVLCDKLLGVPDASPMQALATVAREQNNGMCVTIDWIATLNSISDTSMNATEEDGIRSWLWQTCTEFGFYQTCEAESICPFGRGYHEIDWDLEICERCFGIPKEQVAKNVNESLLFYGGYNLDVSRVLSVNGDVDPWAVLALTKDTSQDLPTHWVYGASHHYWTHPVQPYDDYNIQNARALIYLQVMKWLKEVDDGLLLTVPI